MLQQVELASTFFNKFFICCSYYHPRNQFLRNKNLRNLVWLVEISVAASREFSNINKDGGRRKWTDFTWPKVIRSTKVLIEYYKQIDQYNCGTTISFSPNQNVQSRHASTRSHLLTSLTKARLLSDVLEDLEELPRWFLSISFPFHFTDKRKSHTV